MPCRKGLIAQQSGDRAMATQALAEASAIAASTDMSIPPMLAELEASLNEAP